jgi:hypothetical protein
MSLIDSCFAFLAASLFLWKRPMGQHGLFAARLLLLFTAVEIGSVIITEHHYVQGLRSAFDAFMNLGLGYFMFIAGGVAAVMIWVFDRW